MVLHIFLGVPEAIKELQADLNPCPIKTLWRDGKVVCYSSSNVLLSFAENIYKMRNTKSDVFSKIWSETMQHACKSDISIGDVEVQVWNPAFAKCHEILDKLSDKSMTLADVDKQFVQYNKERLGEELNMLCRGVGDSRDSSWINEVVEQIESYRHLCSYRDTASTLLELKETLGLKGDFKSVEMISQKVRDLTLHVIGFSFFSLFIVILLSEEPDTCQH